MDEILHTDNDYVVVKDGGKTYKITENVTVIEKARGDSMDSRWKAYEDEGLDPASVAQLLAELSALRAEKRSRATTKRLQPTRKAVDDDDFTALTNVIQLAALRATGGGDTYEHRVEKDKDEAKPVNVTQAFGASFDDLPEGRSGETN